MITGTGPLWLWSRESASWHFISVPEEQAGEIRAHSLLSRGGFGSVRSRHGSVMSFGGRRCSL